MKYTSEYKCKKTSIITCLLFQAYFMHIVTQDKVLPAKQQFGIIVENVKYLYQFMMQIQYPLICMRFTLSCITIKQNHAKTTSSVLVVSVEMQHTHVVN